MRFECLALFNLMQKIVDRMFLSHGCLDNLKVYERNYKPGVISIDLIFCCKIYLGNKDFNPIVLHKVYSFNTLM